MKELKKLKVTKWDKIIVVCLLIISFLPTAIFTFLNKDNQNSNIVIMIENETVKSIPLKNDSFSKVYEFSFNNNIGYIEMKNGKVRMVEMDKEICPNGICSDTGWIDKSYQSIVCLPNKIIVSIQGSKNEVIDSQTY